MPTIEASAPHPRVIRIAPNSSKINALGAAGTDNADDADDFGKSSAGEKPGVITTGFHNMDDDEPQGAIVVNGFAISATPEDRQEPEPKQLFARIRIRTIKPAAISPGPDDDLFVV